MKSLKTSYAALFTRVFEGDVTVARIEMPIMQRDFALRRCPNRRVALRGLPIAVSST